MENKAITSTQLYDRQIQEYGEKAQENIQKSTVLVWGLETSSCELVKNLALIGFNLLLSDDRKAKKELVGNTPLTTELDADETRTMAQVIKEKLSDINPIIGIEIKEEEEIKDLDVKIMAMISSAPYKEQLKRRKLMGVSKVFLFFIVGTTYQKLALCEHMNRRSLSKFSSFEEMVDKVNTAHNLDILPGESKIGFEGDFVFKCIFGAALSQIIIQIAIKGEYNQDMLLYAQNMNVSNPNDIYVFRDLRITN